MTEDIHAEKIVILDFGSQVTQLIARRIRESGVYAVILPHDAPEAEWRALTPRGIVLSGGPASVTAPGAPRAPEWVFTAGVPVLGICYGLQTMTVQLGGAVAGAERREYGHAIVTPTGDCPWLAGLSDHDGVAALDVWMSHGDQVTRPAPGFAVVGTTPTCPYAAVCDPDRRFYGVQFHPEVTHTKQGAELLRRFAREICGCEGRWTPQAIVADAVSRLRTQIGAERVLLGLSGGVDSAVTAALLQRAIGAQLTCVFVDNGLLRQDEGRQVREMFAGTDLHLVYVDAGERFLTALRGLDDPEEKRRAIGRTFVEVFAAEARRLQGCKYLAQGTIYPDVIESAAARTRGARVIKSHHNVGGLPPDLHFALVEPLRELFKDEVRKIGVALGLPERQVYRHPFPGPGLGVRVLGEVKPAYLDLLRRADAIFMEELRHAGWYDRVSQAFAVFLPVRAVGVMGDQRTYDYVVALRAVNTVDFMTATWAQLPYELLGRTANRIINEVRGVSRVVYDVSSKPPATVEFE